jgi:hypothetical protein
MKRILVVLIALGVLLAFGTASAVSLRPDQLPKHIKFDASTYFGLWFPSAIDAELPEINAHWTWVLVIANWYSDAITVTVALTAFNNDPNNVPMIRSFPVMGYQKILLTPSDFAGFFNTIADIWVTTDAPIFGGTLYLLDSNSGQLITTVPHMEVENY